MIALSADILPTGFGHAGNKSAVSHLSEADTTYPESADIAAASAADTAAVVGSHLKLGCFLLFLYKTCFSHLEPLYSSLDFSYSAMISWVTFMGASS